MIILLVVLAVIAVLLIGGLVIGLALKLLWWALLGLAIGALARLVLPGRQKIGLLATSGAGIAGSIGGGIVAHAFGLGNILQFLVAIGLAAAVIALLGGTSRRRF